MCRNEPLPNPRIHAGVGQEAISTPLESITLVGLIYRAAYAPTTPSASYPATGLILRRVLCVPLQHKAAGLVPAVYVLAFYLKYRLCSWATT